MLPATSLNRLNLSLQNYHMVRRSHYLFIISAIIILGLLSRKLSAIPAWFGDILYALMMFFIIRFVLLRRSTMLVMLLSLGICLAIECSQLYQATWINAIRATLPGRLVLGQGFLVTDLIAYTFGALLGAGLERFVFNTNRAV